MATLYDVCKKTGLSTATVSRVINGSDKVRETTRQRVQRAMKELNYRPNQAARMLAGKKTDTIGVIFPEINNGFYAQVLRGIDDATRESGLHLLTSFYHSPNELKGALQRLAAGGRTDALVLMNIGLSDQQIQSQIDDDFPIVLIGHSAETSTAFDVVGIDNAKGAYHAVRHLFELNRENLILLTGPADNFDSTQRLEGARMAFSDAGKDFSTVTLLEDDFTYEGGKRAMETFLSGKKPLLDAVFAFNDPMALGVLDALQEAGYSVPEDVAVIGFDDNEIARHIGMTTVHVPMRDVGYEAATLAIRRKDENTRHPSTITIATSLVKRRTTGET
ncbi:MAG: LacI family DNA-binding transcriptional regulator [Verrucomicrobia bacterium]|nr:LacI family DNA-binding transcriptional regulator [Verrucomicrobiota bacterium]